MGAGGKMGCRILNNLKEDPNYEVACVEVGEPGIHNLKTMGVSPVPESDAVGDADAVVLALPDCLIGQVSETLAPQLKPGALVISLDPAAAYAGVIPIREELAYFVCHPCHPPLFEVEETREAQMDFFGGVAPNKVLCVPSTMAKRKPMNSGKSSRRPCFNPSCECIGSQSNKWPYWNQPLSKRPRQACCTLARKPWIKVSLWESLKLQREILCWVTSELKQLLCLAKLDSPFQTEPSRL